MSESLQAAVAISVVLPVFNEEHTVAEVIKRTRNVLQARGEPFEIIVVDDGSTDRTPEILRALTSGDPSLRVLTFSRNFGQAAALSCGLFAARGERVLTLDADLQNPPEEIPKLLAALTPEVDMVSALRAARPEPWWRFLGSRVVHWIARLLVGRDLRDYGGQFKLYRREVIEATRQAWAPGKPFFALAVWLGFRVVEVPVRHEPRRHGRSRYTAWSLARLNLDIITSFTTLPLVLVSVGAAVAGAATLLLGMASLVLPLSMHSLEPVLLFVAALLLSAVGVLGVYAARLYRMLFGPRLGFVLRSQYNQQAGQEPQPAGERQGATVGDLANRA